MKTNYVGKNMFSLSGNYIIKDVQSRDDVVDNKDQLRNAVQMVHWRSLGYKQKVKTSDRVAWITGKKSPIIYDNDLRDVDKGDISSDVSCAFWSIRSEVDAGMLQIWSDWQR